MSSSVSAVATERGVLDDGAGGGTLREAAAEIVVVEHVGDAVGAEEGDVAIGQFALETVRLDLRREADGAIAGRASCRRPRGLRRAATSCPPRAR